MLKLMLELFNCIRCYVQRGLSRKAGWCWRLGRNCESAVGGKRGGEVVRSLDWVGSVQMVWVSECVVLMSVIDRKSVCK